MKALLRTGFARTLARGTMGLAVVVLTACGASSSTTSDGPTQSSPTTTTTTTTTTGTSTGPQLPGTGKPTVTIGDKNFTEQFVLGELYYQALQAQGFSVQLNRNIGPTEVTIQALQSGRLSMYPEYIDSWNTSVAGYRRGFRSSYAAYQAGERYALAHGFELLDPTPFGDTDAIGVTFNYSVQNGVNSISDLTKVASKLILGAPPQFQTNPADLPTLEQVYGVIPQQFSPLAVGAQYQALDQGTVQAADVNTTDGELITGNYTLLRDPKHLFGWGNVVPVVPVRVLDAEGPAFAGTIDQVSALLSIPVMRQLNAAVDISGVDPALVAKQFLQAHGLVPVPGSTGPVPAP
jgi:osmoprotectant transport system substrate-binding protein